MYYSFNSPAPSALELGLSKQDLNQIMLCIGGSFLIAIKDPLLLLLQLILLCYEMTVCCAIKFLIATVVSGHIKFTVQEH